MTTLLSVRDLHVSYGKVEAVSGVSLDLQAGQIVTVIGPSGSGKSTLLSCINFLEPFDSGEITVDGEPVAVQVRPIPNGFRLAHRGIETTAFVYTDSESAAARLMPVKVAADTGKKLLCPMPGLVVSIAVSPGQEVKAGETLAVVEAMKMENVLRAERDGTVKAVFAKKGDSLAVDAVILEFA